jgi:hypothetical protein
VLLRGTGVERVVGRRARKERMAVVVDVVGFIVAGDLTFGLAKA